MIANIRDRRKRPYRWKSVDVMIEATAYDNCVNDTDETDSPPPDWTLVDGRNDVSIAEAIAWANTVEHPVTLYIYDGGTLSEEPVEEDF